LRRFRPNWVGQLHPVQQPEEAASTVAIFVAKDSVTVKREPIDADCGLRAKSGYATGWSDIPHS